jgi:predicted nucleic acid-binding protein
MKNNKIFIDTNILIYASVKQSLFHHKALQKLQNYQQNDFELWINRQVIREYLVVLSRPQTFSHPISNVQLLKDIQYFNNHFNIADDNQRITKELTNLITNYSVMGKQIHDANIVATMVANGILDLFTHNVKDFARYSNIIKILPL